MRLANRVGGNGVAEDGIVRGDTCGGIEYQDREVNCSCGKQGEAVGAGTVDGCLVPGSVHYHHDNKVAARHNNSAQSAAGEQHRRVKHQRLTGALGNAA